MNKKILQSSYFLIDVSIELSNEKKAMNTKFFHDIGNVQDIYLVSVFENSKRWVQKGKRLLCKPKAKVFLSIETKVGNFLLTYVKYCDCNVKYLPIQKK